MRGGLVRALAGRNLKSDRFGTICAILGVALGTATVNVVLVLDMNTRAAESRTWTTNPDLSPALSNTIQIRGVLASGVAAPAQDAKEETHEDYQVMRSAIRLGSLSAFLVGALIVFFTFGVVVERRKREIALLRSLGALPWQVARVIVAEAIVVGAAGAILGFFLAVPLSFASALAGVTTTGRAQLNWIWFPWKLMLLVSTIGGSVALLGVARPAWSLVRLDVARTLAPRFLRDDDARRIRRPHSSGVTLITLPFMALLYLLMRPFFLEVLPSLAFFVLEAGAVCLAFLLVIVLVPEAIRVIGGLVARALPRGPAAARLLVVRRIERMGGELGWSISALMLVFSLLLSLHIVTRALKREVLDWGENAVRPYTFVYSRGQSRVPDAMLPALPDGVALARFSGRTPWPNAIHAVDASELVRLVKATGREDLAEIATRLGPSKIIVSRMMARRFGVAEGDLVEIDGKGGKKQLQVAAVTDDVGYTPMFGPYRNSKTYGLIDASDFGLIAPYASPPGAALAFATNGSPPAGLDRIRSMRGFRVDRGVDFERDRVRETDRDFAIFDLILLFTTVLAAIGIANGMVLSIHGRRREVALYRVLGMTARQVRRMFVLEGAFVGLVGGPLAVALGVPLGAAAIAALEQVSAFEVRFDFPAHYAALTIIGATAVAVLSSLYPAGRAAGSSSAESVHYE